MQPVRAMRSDATDSLRRLQLRGMEAPCSTARPSALPVSVAVSGGEERRKIAAQRFKNEEERRHSGWLGGQPIKSYT